MSESYPKLTDLPEQFAVFPLTGALLLPGGRLPLNIFEPRYLAMTEDALAQGRVIGMIQPDPKLGTTPHGPGLYRIGCLGRLTSFSETEDGRYLITLSGLIRFAVVEELDMARGYRRVRADFSAFAADLDLIPGAHTRYDRPRLLAALRAYFVRRGFDADWTAIEGMADTALVISLAMVCPFDPAEKQALLEAPTLSAQADILTTLLQMDLHDGYGDPEDDDHPGRHRPS